MITLYPRMKHMSTHYSPIVDTPLLKEVIQGASVGVIIYDADHRCILKNEQVKKLLELPDDFVEYPFTFEALVEQLHARGDYGQDQSLTTVIQFYQHRMQAQSPLHIERRAASGKWLELRYIPLSEQRAMFTYKDITVARKHEEQARRFESIIHSSEDAIVTKDLHGRITSWNPAAERIFGYNAEEAIGKHISLIFPADHSSEARHILDEVCLGHRVKPFDTVRLRKDGTLAYVSVSVAPVHDKFSKIIGACKIARNIQDRIKAQDDLELAQQVFSNASEAIMVCDAANMIVSVNPAFTRLTGYQAEEALGNNPSFLSSGNHDQAFYQQMWHEIAEKGSWDGEISNRKKNGELFIEWLRVSSAYKQDGSLHRRIAIFSDITEKKQTEQKIWIAANYDQLTQLPNRHFFQAKLNEHIASADRYHHGFALLFLDLDKFKEVNDTHGHLYGDSLLKQVAERISSCLRKTDFVSRLGGDEFTVILSNLDQVDHISEIAQKILDSLQMPFDLALPDGEDTFISGSIGITLYPNDALNQVELIKNADQAMYLAKRNGRDCYRYFSSELNTQALERLKTTQELRHAIAEHQFEVFYQPIIDLSTNTVKKAEALLRWHHPQQGMLLPDTFIKIAEETGLIHELGEWVLRKVEMQAKQVNHDQQALEIQFSVNVSPIQLHARNNHLQRLANEGLSTTNIVLEITESVLLNIDDFLTNTMYLFRDKGIQVAIDDFGTGYSSLDYLRRLDIDYLKIDQSFIQNLGPQSHDNALCEAIIMMAHKLGIKVIAEGIETQAQHDLLVSFGCDMGQGYYYYRPMSFDDFVALDLHQPVPYGQ